MRIETSVAEYIFFEAVHILFCANFVTQTHSCVSDDVMNNFSGGMMK